MGPEIRGAAVAGSFYASDELGLTRQIAWCFDHPLGPSLRSGKAGNKPPLALISPHAGYRYSGPIAANAYRTVRSFQFDLVVVIGPNHRLQGAPIAAPTAKLWRTPLGTVRIDREAVAQLAADMPQVEFDDVAHRAEHSIEVQIPFLQHVLGEQWRLVPLVAYEQDVELAMTLGVAIANLLRGRKGLVIASSDFTHYETHDSATKKDRFALSAIVAMDPEQLINAIEKYRISMCGHWPVVAAMVACSELGVGSGRVLRYATSGEVAGNYEEVVGYGAIALG